MKATILVLFIVAATMGAHGAAITPVEDFFPFGVYIGGNAPVPTLQEKGVPVEEQVEAACADLEAHHFNCVWPNNLSPKYLDAWLASAEKHGLRVIPQGGGMPMYLLNAGWWKDRWEPAIEKQVKPFYRDVAQKYRDNRTLLAYSIVEEIPPDSPFFPHIAAITREMATLDPNHPVIVLYNRVTAAARAAREVKPRAIGYDIYPFFATPSGPQTWPAQRSFYERQIARFYQAARECNAPLWVMAQAWSSRAVNDKGETTKWLMSRPTPAQMRYQIWAALFQGAKGVFFYSYQGPTGPKKGQLDEHLRDCRGQPLEHYEEAAQVTRQLDPIKPLLLRLDVAPADRQVVYWENLPDVHGQTFLHRDTGDRYLMALNTDINRPQPVNLEFGYFQHTLSGDDRFFDLETGTPRKGADLRELTITPGAGRLFLIGQDDAWQRHKQWMATAERP